MPALRASISSSGLESPALRPRLLNAAPAALLEPKQGDTAWGVKSVIAVSMASSLRSDPSALGKSRGENEIVLGNPTTELIWDS
jgi:hypothetical protein